MPRLSRHWLCILDESGLLKGCYRNESIPLPKSSSLLCSSQEATPRLTTPPRTPPSPTQTQQNPNALEELFFSFFLEISLCLWCIFNVPMVASSSSSTARSSAPAKPLETNHRRRRWMALKRDFKKLLTIVNMLNTFYMRISSLLPPSPAFRWFRSSTMTTASSSNVLLHSGKVLPHPTVRGWKVFEKWKLENFDDTRDDKVRENPSDAWIIRYLQEHKYGASGTFVYEDVGLGVFNVRDLKSFRKDKQRRHAGLMGFTGGTRCDSLFL